MLGFGCVAWRLEAESFFIHHSGLPAAFSLLKICFLLVPWGLEIMKVASGGAVEGQSPPGSSLTIFPFTPSRKSRVSF